MEYDVAEQARKDANKLQMLRRDFAQLQKDEDKYLVEREARAVERLSGVQRQIDSSASYLGSITDKIGKAVGEYKDRFDKFVNRFALLLKRSDDIIKSVVLLNSRADKLKGILDKKYSELQGFEGRLGEWEQDLTGREKEVKQLHNEADEKLAEATQLADWAHSGQRYVIKPKK